MTSATHENVKFRAKGNDDFLHFHKILAVSSALYNGTGSAAGGSCLGSAFLQLDT